MDNFGVFLIYAAITAFSFFVAAPMILNAVSEFGVQKRFTDDMIARGIITEDAVKALQPKKQIAGVIISAIILAALLLAAFKIRLGFFPMCIGLLIGLIRFRHVLQFNTLTVKRFQNAYRDQYDSQKLKEYVNKTF